MRRDIISSIIAIVTFTVLLGLAYPLLMTGIAKVVFPGKADGSKVSANGRIVGSRLIGQEFRKPVMNASGKQILDATGAPVTLADKSYFQPRPSTATHYNAAASSFTNLGPNSTTAKNTLKANLDEFIKLERPFYPGLEKSKVPVDAVTSSGSGIDPHISAANAAIQAHRVAKVRHIPISTVRHLIDEHTNGRFAGVIGEKGVNVLELNLALDGLK